MGTSINFTQFHCRRKIDQITKFVPLLLIKHETLVIPNMLSSTSVWAEKQNSFIKDQPSMHSSSVDLKQNHTDSPLL